MNPDIFITDFERTENTDELHAILGRALIIATRFDTMCSDAANIIKLKANWIPKRFLSDEEYGDFINTIIPKYRKLVNNIKSIGFPEKDGISILLNDARLARNIVAHDLTKELTGCLDTKINENELIKKVSELIIDIAYGDLIISLILSDLTNEPIPQNEFLKTYRNNVLSWVTQK